MNKRKREKRKEKEKEKKKREKKKRERKREKEGYLEQSIQIACGSLVSKTNKVSFWFFFHLSFISFTLAF